MQRGCGPRSWLAAIALVLCSSTALAKTSDGDAALRAGLEEFQAKDLRLQSIGWNLTTGNALFCTDTVAAIGLQVVDVTSFGAPDKIRSAMGLEGDFAVQTAAGGSPSRLARLRFGRELVTIDGVAINSWPSGQSNHWQRQAKVHDTIDASLAADGKVALGLADGEVIEIAGLPACSTRFELASGHKRAMAEGKRVILGEDFVGFTFTDVELAGAIAHELAHNVLGHRAWLDEHGRKRKKVRATEREADRLMPWLLNNAGYRADAALRFMNRWGPRHSAGIFRKRTHEGWDERAGHIQTELDRMSPMLCDHGCPVDWSSHFRREISATGDLTPVE